MAKNDIPEFSYAARRGRPAVDSGMLRIALGASLVAVVVIAVAMLWSGMKPGMGFGPPPVITAPPGPLRVAPADPGGLTVPGADQQIMSGAASAPSAALAPAAPAPAIGALNDAAGLPAPTSTPAPAPGPASAPVAAGN